MTKMTTSSASGVVIGRPGENTRCKLELTGYCLDVQGVCCKQLMYMCCTHRSAIYSVTPLSSRGIVFPALVFSCFCHLRTSFFPINRSSVKTLGCQLRRLTSFWTYQVHGQIDKLDVPFIDSVHVTVLLAKCEGVGLGWARRVYFDVIIFGKMTRTPCMMAGRSILV